MLQEAAHSVQLRPRAPSLGKSPLIIRLRFQLPPSLHYTCYQIFANGRMIFLLGDLFKLAAEISSAHFSAHSSNNFNYTRAYNYYRKEKVLPALNEVLAERTMAPPLDMWGRRWQWGGNGGVRFWVCSSSSSTVRQRWAPVTPSSFIEPPSCLRVLHQSLRFRMTNKTTSQPHWNGHKSDTMLFYCSYFWRLKSLSLCCCIIDVLMASLCLLITYFLGGIFVCGVQRGSCTLFFF